jgi:hypothetical protein
MKMPKNTHRDRLVERDQRRRRRGPPDGASHAQHDPGGDPAVGRERQQHGQMKRRGRTENPSRRRCQEHELDALVEPRVLGELAGVRVPEPFVGADLPPPAVLLGGMDELVSIERSVTVGVPQPRAPELGRVVSHERQEDRPTRQRQPAQPPRPIAVLWGVAGECSAGVRVVWHSSHANVLFRVNAAGNSARSDRVAVTRASSGICITERARTDNTNYCRTIGGQSEGSDEEARRSGMREKTGKTVFLVSL